MYLKFVGWVGNVCQRCMALIELMSAILLQLCICIPYLQMDWYVSDAWHSGINEILDSATFLTQQVYCRAFIRVFDWKENQLIHPLSLLSKISFLFPQIRQYLAKLFFICFEFYTITILIVGQELLELLQTVYSEEKLQSCLKLTKFQNLFIRISQQVYQKYHAQKRPKICTCCRVSEAKMYLYYSSKKAKAAAWV